MDSAKRSGSCTIAGLYSRSTNKAVTQQTHINKVKILFAMSEQSSRFQLSMTGEMPVPFKRVSHSFACINLLFRTKSAQKTSGNINIDLYRSLSMPHCCDGHKDRWLEEVLEQTTKQTRSRSSYAVIITYIWLICP